MATYRQIHTKIWTSPDFQKLSIEGKLVFVHLFSNSHRNEAALYRVTEKTIKDETGVENIAAVIEELVDAELVKYANDLHLIWIKNAIKYQKLSPNEITAIAKNIFEHRGHPYFTEFVEYHRSTIPELPEYLASTSQGSSVRVRIRVNNKGNIYDHDFEQWWIKYPRKIAKVKAREAYIKRREEGMAAEDLHKYLDRYLAQIEAKEIEERFIMHGTTFLNSRWEDYTYDPVATPKKTKPPKGFTYV